jgi:hypothetical protein
MQNDSTKITLDKMSKKSKKSIKIVLIEGAN